jgi:hypothetical protein
MDAIQGTGLSFQPLYWVFHDSWSYQKTSIASTFYHYGHVHFFMLGYRWRDDNADAFNGAQSFRFEIEDLWGPRSQDPNQSLPYRVVGTPKWYWRIEEVWRRVYIQKWDERIDVKNPNQAVGRRGIRWDACDKGKTLGPFREGSRFAPLYVHNARTLPIEYFRTDEKLQTKRDNRVGDMVKAGIDAWNPTPLGQLLPRTYDPDKYGLDHGGHVVGGPRATPSFPDALYIGPTIEYQKVVQLDWERMPGWAQLHDVDDDTFGDGWANSVQIPFVNPVTQKYNSPFGPSPGVVHPVGEYFGQDLKGQPLVSLDKRLMHRLRQDNPPSLDPSNPSPGGYDTAEEPFGLPAFVDNDPKWTTWNGGTPLPHDPRPNLSGQPMAFYNPYGEDADGKWVQQCLGGLVMVKAEVTLEHRLGGRSTQWITATQLIPTASFAGTDQSPKP